MKIEFYSSYLCGLFNYLNKSKLNLGFQVKTHQLNRGDCFIKNSRFLMVKNLFKV